MKIGINIKLGILAGLINCLAWYGFAKKLGFYTIDVYVYRNYVTLAVLIIGVFACVFLTKKSQNGFLDFKDGLKTGIVYSLTLAIIISIFNYVYYTYITPDTIEYFLTEAKKSDFAKTLSASDLPKFLATEKGNFSSFKLIPPIIFFGLISSLLAGAAFRKKDPSIFEEN
ncbi:hypothetical protein BH10BAC1_BH10BAC1_04460 [soil metagenome]